MTAVFIIAGLVLLIALLVPMITILSFFQPWLQATASGVTVPFTQLIGMRLRKVHPPFILDQAIRLAKAGIDVSLDDLETHVLSGGDLAHVVNAVVTAAKAGIDIDFSKLAAIDLAGRDVLSAVNAVVSPAVISCPGPREPAITGVAKDGVRVGTRVRITVRTNLSRLVGGAGEETIQARVGEGIVSAIGSCDSHKHVLETPEFITQWILNRGLDSGTAFEIVSVDVADVDVVDNVGARLTDEQARSDEQVAQARAEMRRVMAVAKEREMRARVVEMTSHLTAARAVVPLAIAGSCKRGNIWRSPRPVQVAPGRQLWNLHEK